MSPRIELATAADLDDLCELERAAFGAAAWSRAGIAGALGHASGLALVARESQQGELLGAIQWLQVADEAELLRLAVRPAARRAGVATLLLDRSLGDLRERGVGQVFLEVRADNEAARALYRRRGWADAGVRAGYYDDGIDAVLMSQALPVACPESSRRVPSS
jgi:ribosomal-protein-alanine N-acetyltransferase